jgi:hypothetical protein
MKSIEQLKKEYNELALKLAKADVYMDDHTKPIAEREKFVPRYRELTKQMANMLKELEQAGVRWTEDEAIGGFAS